MAAALDAEQFLSLEKPLYETEECSIDTSNLMACALELQSASPSKQLADHEAFIDSQPRTDSYSPLVSAISGPPNTDRMTLRASTRNQRDLSVSAASSNLQICSRCVYSCFVFFRCSVCSLTCLFL